MAARVWAAPAPEGLLFNNDSVSLCLLVNRRVGTMRIFDFRAGASASKRTFMLSTARRERIERVFIVVEREEVGTWTRLGLNREGSIPAFYKRSDGFVLGTALDPDGTVPVMVDRGRPRQTRASIQADAELAELSYKKARVWMKKHITDPAPMAFKFGQVEEGEARKAVWTAGRCGDLLSAFEPFGRNSDRMYFQGSLRGGPSFWMSAEIQPCFDHALIEFLTPPHHERDCVLFRTGLELVASTLKNKQVVGMFAFSPTDDPALASVFLAAGFRRTGLLARHQSLRGQRKDAFLWTRKHPLPGEE